MTPWAGNGSDNFAEFTIPVKPNIQTSVQADFSRQTSCLIFIENLLTCYLYFFKLLHNLAGLCDQRR